MVPVPRRSELLLQQQGWRPVQLSKADRAPEVTLSEDRLSATSAKGFRMVRISGLARSRELCVEVLRLGELMTLSRLCCQGDADVAAHEASNASEPL